MNSNTVNKCVVGTVDTQTENNVNKVDSISIGGKNNMKQNKIRARRYMLTWNNPPEDWVNIVKTKLGQLTLMYWCFSHEIGLDCGTPHIHIYFASQNAIAWERIVKLFDGCHVETAKGSSIECRNYVGKMGKWHDDEKAETNKYFEEWGDVPIEKQGKRTDWDIAYEMLEDGYSVSEIINIQRHMMRYRTALEMSRQEMIESRYRKVFRKLDIVYIQGATGLGKTRGIMEKYDYDVCQITGYQHGCFDKYNCQDVVIFDEFASGFRIQDMNNYLDGYPMFLPCRYTNKMACYTKVYIISNIPLEQQYADVKNKNREVWDALMRRIDKVRIFTEYGKYDEYDTNDYFDMINGKPADKVDKNVFDNVGDDPWGDDDNDFGNVSGF